MKKILILILSVLAFIAALAGCGHEHIWVEATCTEPKTCSVCGETEGEALGHTWAEATCAAPKTCSVCGETEGEALGHTWVEATYEAPKTCSVCGETEGERKPTWLESKGIEKETSSTVKLTAYIIDNDLYTSEYYKYDGNDFDYHYVMENSPVVYYTETYKFSETTDGVEEGYKLITVEETQDYTGVPANNNTKWAWANTWFDKYTGYNVYPERDELGETISKDDGVKINDEEIDLGDRIVTIHTELEKVEDNRNIWKFTVPVDYDGLGMTVLDFYGCLDSASIAIYAIQNGGDQTSLPLYNDLVDQMCHYVLAEDFI